ncbi:hypothetical protein PPSIR1_00100 [Plesiocystis pacifica SIR-1]|uniref:Lipoprotein n=1 Tax=Plesiocystis pacifica SIR-1 TaxID=391625 RepID=A6GET5_9BACT|nr:hypothetical protein [Plesiocystis pacifica]EDM75597.1 hypothetical protein PPSIR1_00100 [Plesiocystis pacifica SIR-1]
MTTQNANAIRLQTLRLGATALSIAMSVAAGCGGAEGSEGSIEVPEVRAAVALDELCELSNELRCAGAMGCCDADAPFGTMDECLDAGASCEDTLAEVLGSELYTSGAIVYDPEFAAGVLSAAANATAECGTQAAIPDLGELFTGTRGEGEDCSPASFGEAHRMVCAAGLSCFVDDDEDADMAVGTCLPLDFDHDESEDAPPSVEALYCSAPAELSPPSNGVVPVGLSVNAYNSTHSGTNSDVVLHFINKSETTEYYCTIKGGVDSNETKICSNIKTRTYNGVPSNNLFWVETFGSDGFGVDSVAVCTSLNGSGTQCDGTTHTAGTFDTGNSSMLEKRITWAFGMFDDGFDRIWLDSDSNGNCNTAKINLNNDNTVTCGTHTVGNH